MKVLYQQYQTLNLSKTENTQDALQAIFVVTHSHVVKFAILCFKSSY